MSLEFEKTGKFSEQDFSLFQNHLKKETSILKKWFREEKFENKPKYGGLELESWILDEKFQPAPFNQEILKEINHPFIVPELSRFNLELNLTPLPIGGRVLCHFQDDLEQYWKNCNACAAKFKAQLLMIGILPTLQKEDLTLEKMSPSNRYKALNNQVMDFREGKPISLNIKGRDQLQTQCDHVMLESAGTSLQIHLLINQKEAKRVYNAAHILSAPMIGASANSPFLFGKNLWDETRIILFEQSVALDTGQHKKTKMPNRVFFGSSYVKKSLMECFTENLERFPVLLPMELEQNPEDLGYLRYHNGSIWRWNRPLIGISMGGQAHLRLEHRIIPAGPSLVDVVANIAFFLGLVEYLRTQRPCPESKISFTRAKKNFYLAAQKGLDAKITWLDGKTYKLQDLILKKLISTACDGLKLLGIHQADIDFYIKKIIRQRVETGQNGAAWQRAFVVRNGLDWTALTRAYASHQKDGHPVHEWKI